MRQFLYTLYRSFSIFLLKRQGFVLSNDAYVSRKGLAKIGSAKVFMAEHAQINAHCLLLSARDIHIGENSTLAYGVTVLTSANPNAPYNDLCKIYPPLYAEVYIGDNVWVGARSVILPGVKIGNNVVIAAGSVVTKDVPENVMVAGVPAVVKKSLEELEVVKVGDSVQFC